MIKIYEYNNYTSSIQLLWSGKPGLYHMNLFFCCVFGFFFPVSQCNISLKKQRSRSIFSTLFCCFRDYNVEPPSTNSTSALPPLVEENGGLQKVRILSYFAVMWVFRKQGLILLPKFCPNRFPSWGTAVSYRKNYWFDGGLLILSVLL